MALKVELKPGERIVIGDCVITNSERRATFLIDGKAPIIRERDIITADQADTPAKRIYLSILLMYTSHQPEEQHGTYFALVRDIVQAAPSTWSQVEIINNHILTGDLYKALKQAKQLIQYEQELMNDAGGASVRKGRKTGRDPA